MNLRGIAVLLAVAVPVIGAVPAAAQGSYSPYDESASTALARYVRTLASSPKDFGSLVGAGRAALELGDTQAAAGFFARADEVNPRSPLPQAGMGAVSVVNGEPLGALPYFERARQLGAPVASFACDRGLAYDLLGRQAEAQADYRLALTGADGDEARRRLALSLAISGDRNGALAALSPLLAKGDAGANRAKAFALALTGDTASAMRAIDGAMPGSWAQVSPFLTRLPGLRAGEKAAAVNLGIFPDSSGTAYAAATPVPQLPPPTAPSVTAPLPSFSSTVTTNRLAGVEALLKAPPAQQVPSFQAAPPQPQQQVASVALPAPGVGSAPASSAPLTRVQAKKIWLQLASGQNPDALPGQFDRIKNKNRDLFDGIKGYVAKGSDRARLVIGPFRSTDDAETFAEDLHSVDVNAFRWSNSETDMIVPLGTQ